MGREILVVHFGQAGVQMGSAIWELFCIEHRVSVNGELMNYCEYSDLSLFEHLGALFYEGQKTWTPRAVLVDLEPTVIDEIRCGAYRQLWKPNCLITGKEDAANNYGRGNCTIGKLKMDETLDAIRKLVEDSNNLAAFELVHSHSGGTGSGFTSLIIDQLCDEYGKKFKFGTSVFPSPMYSQSTVDPYNAILHAHSTIDTLDCDILVDNQTLYERCTKNLGIVHPSYSEINRLLAQMLSSLFLSHRFLYHGSQHADTTELLTNLIPYPRIHFPSLFYAPLIPRNYVDHDAMTVLELTRAVFNEEAQTIDFPCRRNAYISCAMLYRGVSSPKQVYDALQVVKGTPSVGATFVDWCPTGFKVGLNVYPPVSFPQSPLAQVPRSVCMLAGNLGMREAWHRNNMKFDVLFSRRCFVHWFIGEGIEESEFIEARDDMAYLEQDYAELMAETGIPSGNDMQQGLNENNPLMTGPPLESDSIHSRLSSKHEMQDMPSMHHIRQSNNANSIYSAGYSPAAVPHRRMPTAGSKQNKQMESGDDSKMSQYQQHNQHTSVPAQRYLTGKFRDSNETGNRVQGINYAEQQHSNHCSNITEKRYNDNDKSAASDAPSTSFHGSTKKSHNLLWPNGDERVVTDCPVSTMHLSSESHGYTPDASKPTGPRNLNTNYPRHSQAISDTAFLPTEPVVRPYDNYGFSHDDTRMLTTDAQGHWSRTSSQASFIPEQSSHRNGTSLIQPDDVTGRESLRRHGASSNASWHSNRSSVIGSSEKTCGGQRKTGAMQQHRPPPGQSVNYMEDEVTKFSAMATNEYNAERTTEMTHLFSAEDPVVESASSGFGSMSSDASSMSTPDPRELLSRTYAGRQDSLATTPDCFEDINNQRRHHKHHHHHRHQHRRHHHRSGSRVGRQTYNNSLTTRADETMPDMCGKDGSLVTENGDKQNQGVIRLSTSVIGQNYRSSPVVAKRPVYEVSISSSPETETEEVENVERDVPTPVLSAWSSLENPPTHTPVAHY